MTTLSAISSFSCSLTSPFCFIADLHTLGSVTHSIHVGSNPNLSLKGRQSWGGSNRRSLPDFLCTLHQFSEVQVKVQGTLHLFHSPPNLSPRCSTELAWCEDKCSSSPPSSIPIERAPNIWRLLFWPTLGGYGLPSRMFFGSRHHIYLLNNFDMHTVQSTIHTEYKYKSIIVLNAKARKWETNGLLLKIRKVSSGKEC